MADDEKVRFEAGLLDYCDECGVMSVLHGADFDFMMEARRNLCKKCWYDDPSDSTASIS